MHTMRSPMRTQFCYARAICRLVLSTLVCSICASSARSQQPAFEVSSIRPAPPGTDPLTGHWSFPGIGRFNATHVSLARLIQLAYNIDGSQIANKPGWLDTNLYDVDAKPETGIHL